MKIDVGKFKADIARVKGKLDVAKQLLNGREVMTGIAEHAKGIVARRTQRGFDSEGRAFAPYTEAYGRIRAKAGRRSRPDLLMTGQMLGDMQTSYIGKGKARVYFARDEQGIKAAGNSTKRPFFEVETEKEKNELVRVAQTLVKKKLKAWGLL